MFALLQQSPSLTWPEAFAVVGGAFAAGWAIRSFMRLLNGDKP
jgi:hypothetical protein